MQSSTPSQSAKNGNDNSVTMPDPTESLIAKAFGDLDTRPFAWCFDPFDDADDHVNDGNTMIAAAADDDEIFEANDPILEYPDATLRSIHHEPQEGVTYYMDGDEFLLMLRRHLGMPDED